MIQTVVVDTNALVAAADVRSPNSEACINVLSRADLRPVIPAMCIAEASYLIERTFSPRDEANFIESLTSFDIRAPEPEDWARIAELVRQYADFPLGGTDASVIALAERLRTDIVLTLDRRHFAAVRPAHVERLRLLPET